MEGLAIFVVIILLNVGITYLKRRGEERKNDDDDYNDRDDETVSGEDSEYESDSDSSENAPQPLQDLIRKFREEQAKHEAEMSQQPQPEPLKWELPRAPETKPVLSRPVTVPQQPLSARPQPVTVPPQPISATPNRFQLTAERYAKNPLPEELDETTAMEISDEIAAPSKATLARRQKIAFNLKEARKGFLWSQVLNRPKFRS